MGAERPAAWVLRGVYVAGANQASLGVPISGSFNPLRRGVAKALRCKPAWLASLVQMSRWKGA
eukprot:9846674-Lingulodinium_polyedra.AAC.1